MRMILAAAMLVLGITTAPTEPDFAPLLAASSPLDHGERFTSSFEIESSVGRGDRQVVTTAEPVPSASPFPTRFYIPVFGLDPASDDPDTNQDQELSIGQLCEALLTSAQDNDLPVAFFANLLWQESGLRNDIVSRKGAIGIAQFMPETAAESGLENPTDPMQAIPASARLLRELREQFGNLGYAAAAYNAGARRVAAWLTRHRTLPRETRGYVRNITGRSVEQWRKTPPQDAALRFVRALPCRQLPSFAQLEQEQQAAIPMDPDVTGDIVNEHVRHGRVIGHLARGRHPHTRLRPEKVHTARHIRRHHVREAAGHLIHARHRGHTSA